MYGLKIIITLNPRSSVSLSDYYFSWPVRTRTSYNILHAVRVQNDYIDIYDREIETTIKSHLRFTTNNKKNNIFILNFFNK